MLGRLRGTRLTKRPCPGLKRAGTGASSLVPSRGRVNGSVADFSLTCSYCNKRLIIKKKTLCGGLLCRPLCGPPSCRKRDCWGVTRGPSAKPNPRGPFRSELDTEDPLNGRYRSLQSKGGPRRSGQQGRAQPPPGPGQRSRESRGLSPEDGRAAGLRPRRRARPLRVPRAHRDEGRHLGTRARGGDRTQPPAPSLRPPPRRDHRPPGVPAPVHALCPGLHYTPRRRSIRMRLSERLATITRTKAGQA